MLHLHHHVNLELMDKVAIVSGGAKGIGEAITRARAVVEGRRPAQVVELPLRTIGAGGAP